MLFPAIIPAAKLLWTQSKWVVLVAALAFSHYYAYTKGAESVYKDQLEDVPKQVAKEQERGKKAVQRAASDVAKIKELERTNAELITRLDSLPERSKCVLAADELLLLQQAADQTKPR